MIDTKGPGDQASLQLSNFMAHEDRASGEIVLEMSRFMPFPQLAGRCLYLSHRAVGDCFPTPRDSGHHGATSAIIQPCSNHRDVVS